MEQPLVESDLLAILGQYLFVHLLPKRLNETLKHLCFVQHILGREGEDA